MSGGGTSQPSEGPVALFPGLVLALVLSGGAIAIAHVPWVRDTLHLSALLLVILLGMAWRSFLPVPANAAPGIHFAQRPVLRWAVAGLGFRLSIQEIAAIGGPALVVVTVSTAVALFFGWWIARRIGLPEKLGLLLGVGGAICGASAVVAADTVVQGEKKDSALSLAVITLLGTVGIVIYPWIARALGMSDFAYGVWDGATLHETAQVVAAGFGVSPEAARVATVVKLARIALLAPVVFYLGWLLRHRHQQAGEAKVSIVPWFLVMFVVFAGLNSLGVIPPTLLSWLRTVDLWLLTIGMAGVGLHTGISDLRAAGLKPVAAGLAQWIVLAVVAYVLTRFLLA